MRLIFHMKIYKYFKICAAVTGFPVWASIILSGSVATVYTTIVSIDQHGRLIHSRSHDIHHSGNHSCILYNLALTIFI